MTAISSVVPSTLINLYEASRQWAERPADQRFASLEELHTACENFKRSAAEADNVNFTDLRVQKVGADDVGLIGSKGIVSAFTHLILRSVVPASQRARQLSARIAR